MKPPTALLQKLHITRAPKHVNVDVDVDVGVGVGVDVHEDHCTPDERSLPPEIIMKIIGYLLEERDRSPARAAFIKHTFQPALRTAVLISKAWMNVVTEYLYKEIYISSSKALETLADTLWTGTGIRLRPYVAQFHFNGKAFGSGSFPMQCTAMDAFNQWRVLHVCPNLQAILQSKPWTKKEHKIDEERKLHKIFRHNGVTIHRVTHLEIMLPNDPFLEGELTFLSNIEFAVLQKLHIVFTVSSKRRAGDKVKPDGLNWPEMPQLRCLTLEDLKISWHHRGRLAFPEKSPFVNAIELLNGDYTMEESLFDPYKGPLCRYADTLETLTITALISGYRSWSRYDYPFWSERNREERYLYLDFLTNLVELCIRGVSYKTIPIQSFPPRLQHFALAAHECEKAYGWISTMLYRLYIIYKDKATGGGPLELKRITILLGNVDEIALKRENGPFDFGRFVRIENNLRLNVFYGDKNLQSEKDKIWMLLQRDMEAMKASMPDLIAKLPPVKYR